MRQMKSVMQYGTNLQYYYMAIALTPLAVVYVEMGLSHWVLGLNGNLWGCDDMVKVYVSVLHCEW